MKEEHLEVRRTARRSAADALLDHLHWTVAIAAAAVLLAVAGGWLFDPSPARAELSRLTEARAKLDDRIGSAEFPTDGRLAEVDRRLTEIVTSLSPKARPAIDLPVGLTYPRSLAAMINEGASNEVRFEPPAGLRAIAEAGGVDLFWADPAGNNVKIKEFEILRSERGAPSVTVGTAPGERSTFRDISAVAGSDYEYRVRAVSKDGAGPGGGAARSAASEPASVRAIADFKLAIRDVTEAGVVVKIGKWHENAWRDREFTVAEGGAVGGKDESVGVDFSTGRRLAKLQRSERRSPGVRNEVVFDADGRVALEGDEARRVKVESVDVVVVVTATFDGGSLPPEVLTFERKP